MGLITKKNTSLLETTDNKKKLASSFGFGITFLVIDIVITIVDPVLIIAKYCVRVDYGTFLHESLMQENAGVYISTYLFNITNADRFQSGEDHKLKVDEVGPFTYQEIRQNEQLEFDFESNVIRYSPKIWTKFLPEKSVGRPEDVNITMPNLAMLSIASKVSSFGFFPRMGYNLLTRQLKTKPIVSMPANEYLWGYEEPLIKLGNTIMPGLVNFDVLGVLDRLYDKKAKYLFELSARSEDKFSIRSVNGSRGLDKWGYRDPEKRSNCNSFVNTYEGIAYPTEMTGDRSLRIYRTVLCRFLELDYNGNIMTPYGVEGLEYKISNRTYRKNEDTDCLCRNGNCIEGVSDLSPCFIGLPVVLSNAHFLYADPKLYERIEGIKPDEKLHGSSFVIEPKIGMVLDTQFSVQVSLLIRDVRFNSETSPYSDMIIPVVIFKIIQPPLTPQNVYYLNLIYFVGPKLVLSVRILLGILAVGLLGYAAKLLYCNCILSYKKQIFQNDAIVSFVVEPLMR